MTGTVTGVPVAQTKIVIASRDFRMDRADDHSRVLEKLVPKKSNMGALRAPLPDQSIRSLTSKHQTRYVLILENDADA